MVHEFFNLFGNYALITQLPHHSITSPPPHHHHHITTPPGFWIFLHCFWWYQKALGGPGSSSVLLGVVACSWVFLAAFGSFLEGLWRFRLVLGVLAGFGCSLKVWDVLGFFFIFLFFLSFPGWFSRY